MSTELTVVVTGASGGLGSAVAEAFGDRGDAVVLVGRGRERLAATAGAVESGGGTATIAAADVREEDAVFGVFANAAPVDVLVHCVGIIDGDPGENPLTETTYETFDSVVETNVRGLFATLREGLQFLREDGRVLVPTGRVAREPTAGMGAYGVSKAADAGLVRGFAADAPQTVGLVDPGLVATDLTRGQGKPPDRVAGLFVWAATECAPGELDGNVVDTKQWKRATR